MREDYFIDISICDTNRNIGEIKEQIKKFLIERDGVYFNKFINMRFKKSGTKTSRS